jgi:hypothetical protein
MVIYFDTSLRELKIVIQPFHGSINNSFISNEL